MNLLKQASLIEKRAGDWNNYWSENLGTLTGSAVGGSIGMTIAHHLPAKYALPVIATSAALPDTAGFLTALLSKRRTEKEQQAIDDDKSQILANMLIPGYAFFNRTSRAVAQVDDKGTTNNLFPENMGQFAGYLVPGSTAIGALLGALMPTRTKEEQDTYDKSIAHAFTNFIPGVAGYNMIQRMKADYK